MPNRTYHKRGELVNGYSARKHPLYVTWQGMLSRCYNKNEPTYKNYGGRGITVCDDWQHFKNFANDMYPKPNKHMTLERVDNTKGYSKDNCVWASRTQQCHNRRKFKNNTSGYTGIKKQKRGYKAVFDDHNVRYIIGNFDDLDDAVNAREKFIKHYKYDKQGALLNIANQVRRNSSTGITGVTPHKDGGYVARRTVNGARQYLGYFKTIDGAVNAINS